MGFFFGTLRWRIIEFTTVPFEPQTYTLLRVQVPLVCDGVVRRCAVRLSCSRSCLSARLQRSGYRALLSVYRRYCTAAKLTTCSLARCQVDSTIGLPPYL
jgi:hypothetical protein